MSSGRVLRVDVLNGVAPPPPPPGGVQRGQGGRGARVSRAGRGRGGAAQAGGYQQLGQAAQVDVGGQVDAGGQAPVRRGVLRRGLTPSRGARSGADRSAGSDNQGSVDQDNTALLQNLTKLVTDLQGKIEKQGEAIEETVQKKLEEEKAKIQHKVSTQINDNLEKFDQSKTKEKFKYKASASAISRIVEVRAKVRLAIVEGDRDFEDFHLTKTGEALKETLEILDRQEGLIRLAESNKHGYRLVDKLKEDKKCYSYLNDPELVKQIKAAEKELDKEGQGRGQVLGQDQDRCQGSRRKARRLEEKAMVSSVTGATNRDTPISRVLSSMPPPQQEKSTTTSHRGDSCPVTSRRRTTLTRAATPVSGTLLSGGTANVSAGIDELRGAPSRFAPAGNITPARQTVKEI